MDFKEFVLSKVIWKDTVHFEALIEAASQITVAPSIYLKDYLSKQHISELYKKIFDLTEKSNSLSVNHYLFKKFNPGNKTDKICSSCKELLPITEFYANGYTPNGTKKYKAVCKICFTGKAKDRFNSIVNKDEWACVCCGYNKCEQALEFHHIDPSEKEFELTSLKSASKEKILKELEKGVILCANCHRETHYGLHPEYLINSVDT